MLGYVYPRPQLIQQTSDDAAPGLLLEMEVQSFYCFFSRLMAGEARPFVTTCLLGVLRLVEVALRLAEPVQRSVRHVETVYAAPCARLRQYPRRLRGRKSAVGLVHPRSGLRPLAWSRWLPALSGEANSHHPRGYGASGNGRARDFARRVVRNGAARRMATSTAG